VCCAATCSDKTGVCVANAVICRVTGGHNCSDQCPGNRCDSAADSSNKKHKKHKSHRRKH
jgi:hypothetical protein